MPFSTALDPLVSYIDRHESTDNASDVANSVGSLLDSNDRIELIKLSKKMTDQIPYRK